jgi:enamine deaminase RidA (YjgF/YER057c/UK114 family)
VLDTKQKRPLEVWCSTMKYGAKRRRHRDGDGLGRNVSRRMAMANEDTGIMTAHRKTLLTLQSRGLALPALATPAASYVPAVRTGDLIYTSGQLPIISGKMLHQGKVGAEVTVESAVEAARICLLNGLAAVASLADLDAITRIVKLVGFVSSAPGFTGQPSVINGASELLASIFGDAGQHARSAVGVAELPFNSPVEVEMIVEVRSV